MRPHRRPAPADGPKRNPARRAVFTDSMTGTTRPVTGRRAGARHRLAFGGLCGLLLALTVAIAVPAGATSARVIGKTKHTPSPDCPKTPCNAIGSVTGFQLAADGKKRPV